MWTRRKKGQLPDTVQVNLPRTVEFVDRNVNVKEVRAPTEDSVRLLREFEDAARDRIIASYRIPSAIGTCVVEIERLEMTMQLVFHAHAVINGHQISATVRAEPHEQRESGNRPEYYARMLSDELAQRISEQIVYEQMYRVFATAATKCDATNPDNIRGKN